MLPQRSMLRRSTKWEDALMTYVLDKVSNCNEIRCLTIFCNDFSAEYPDHAGKRGTINSRIRTLLRNIDHEKFDDTTLARIMFCLAQPLDGKLEAVRERLANSGKLEMDEFFRITFYKNEYVLLKGTHRHKNQVDRFREERKRRSSPSLAEKYELQMEIESWEMGEREKIKEERRALGIVDPDIKFEIEEDNNSNIPSSSSSTVPSLHFPQEFKFGGIGAKRLRHVEEMDDDRRSDSEAFYDYCTFLKSIHNYTIVLEDPGFVFLRSEIMEELEKPETYGLSTPESKIAEAIDYGIKIVTKSIRPDDGRSLSTFRLHEFLRSLKHQLLNIGIQLDNEIVTNITSVIDKTDPDMVIPMIKIKFALENIFEKIRP
ncbi:unnamed protein product [Caenorhabditis brenneri]